MTGKPDRKRLWTLTLGAIGVVYGDIGTSPLYAVKECFSPHYGLQTGHVEVLGVLSLIFWALVIIISLKYLSIVLRFDNKGEGGVMALMSLVAPVIKNRKLSLIATALGLFGAALLYGDGMITPSISVLSAVEGLSVAAPGLRPLIVPVTIVLLAGLFIIQKRGTGGIGRVFGPFMLLWFATLGTIGLYSIVLSPTVLSAINPYYAVMFFIDHGWMGAAVLGSVFLVVTGGETVYADMGHFGKGAIKRGWFTVAFPCLLLNYFGQGALLMREGANQATIDSPFFHLVPAWGIIPLVVVATFATIIASQAVIAGAFSLTWQAIQLGFLPRLKVLHTSGEERGQIYIPFVNWALFSLTITLVISFGSSSALASAYGIAVSTTMLLSTALIWPAIRNVAKWSAVVATAITLVFFVIDSAFFTANIIKLPDGGYVPVVLAGTVFMLMVTWRKGRGILRTAIEKRNLSLGEVVSNAIDSYSIVPGTALYMTGYANATPPALVSNVRYNKCRHETIILLTINVEPLSHVPIENRIEVTSMPRNFYQVILHYGFMDTINLMHDLSYLPEYDVPVDITDATFILGNETLAAYNSKGMARWRKELFIFMHRNSRTPAKYFGVPGRKMLEIGSHIDI